MGQVVIAAYRPKDGKADELLALTKEHHGILLAQGLVTDRAPIIARSKDGTIVEVFEWVDGAIERAHTDETVQALWQRYQEACDYATLTELFEAGDLFASFEAVN